ncbi:PREDICTED: laccase-2-like isoform X2 [Nicrophorus vespilloides]|uniref:Laccase-2-like isoform X2 n=1 Tax=Nicrophorus vespilloides TaxID=110193 RepID=A0ABM1M806_NICVS|nr:PREDICTED: laccase-2-like isoform X2 [Nicrophorus vespilloides]
MMEAWVLQFLLLNLGMKVLCQSPLLDVPFAELNETDIEYFPLNNQHPCSRICGHEDRPMVCRYHFIVEWYQTLSKACFSCPDVLEDCYKPDCIIGDGTMRTVLVINRKMPGPTIEVCVGDNIIVDVENRLMAETTTIHWHGHHQRGTPYMDGVPYVTQCPIQPGSIFRYNFTAVNGGTHFWHSHTGMQRGDGAFGAFIVRTPAAADPHSQLYDYDLTQHTISLLDWAVDIGLKVFIAHHHSIGDNKPTTLLVNGLGIHDFSNVSTSAPTARFVVEKGYKYRFRLINAGFLNCPVEMSIDNHTMTMISSDGNDFQPVTVDSLVSYAGERFDFVLNANMEKGLYWIRFRGLMDCDDRFTSTHQVAVLQYEGASKTDFPDGPIPNYQDSHNDGLQLNSLNKGTEGNDSISVPQLHSLLDWDSSLKETADEQYYVGYDFYEIDNPHFHKFPEYGFNNVTDSRNKLLTPQLNHISLKLTPFPMLSQRDLIDDNLFCNESTVADKDCKKEFCQCSHVIQVKLNSIVELILVDKGFAFDANHPFHLHGHSFRVVGMERLGRNVTVDEVKRLDAQGLLKRNLGDAPIKDTVTVPDGGYTILRFNASNPGYWLFHCHIEFHVEIGMALIFRFGDDEDMPPVPHGFPKCGEYYGLEPSAPSPNGCGHKTYSFLIILGILLRPLLL